MVMCFIKKRNPFQKESFTDMTYLKKLTVILYVTNTFNMVLITHQKPT